MSLLRQPITFSSGMKKLSLPLVASQVEGLSAGDLVSLTGSLLTGRDQTHRRLCSLLDQGKELPVDLHGELLYYVGPTPPPPGRVIGSAGPTTSYRMDAYTPRLLELGLAATMGNGPRSRGVREAMARSGALYFATIGGAGALLSRAIVKSECIAFQDLGPEALFRFEVVEFPAVVINDLAGNDFYEMVAQRRGDQKNGNLG